MIKAKGKKKEKRKRGCKFRMNDHDSTMLKFSLERAEKGQKRERIKMMQGMYVRRGM
jgi:hypothetical protein